MATTIIEEAPVHDTDSPTMNISGSPNILRKWGRMLTKTKETKKGEKSEDEAGTAPKKSRRLGVFHLRRKAITEEETSETLPHVESGTVTPEEANPATEEGLEDINLESKPLSTVTGSGSVIENVHASTPPSNASSIDAFEPQSSQHDELVQHEQTGIPGDRGNSAGQMTNTVPTTNIGTPVRQKKIKSISAAIIQMFKPKQPVKEEEPAVHTPEEEINELPIHEPINQELSPGETTTRNAFKQPTTAEVAEPILPVKHSTRKALSHTSTSALTSLDKCKHAIQSLGSYVGQSTRKLGRIISSYFSATKQKIRGSKSLPSKPSGLTLESGENFLEEDFLKSTRENSSASPWDGVSQYQLRVMYGAIQASLAHSSSEKMRWLEAICQILFRKGNRFSVKDSLRSSALEGNAILTCLKTLEDAHLQKRLDEGVGVQAKVGTAGEKNTGNISLDADKQKDITDGCLESVTTESEVSPDNLELTKLSLWLLQDLCLNDLGVDLFTMYKGPATVIARLDSFGLTQTSEPDHKLVPPEEIWELSEGLWIRSPNTTELLCLKAAYRLVFATCSKKGDCSDMWLRENTAMLPMATLHSAVKLAREDASYVGLALGVLRILAVKPIMDDETLKQFVAIAVAMIQLHPKDSWVVENAFAVISTGQERLKSITDYVSELHSDINIWQMVISCCKDLQKEGHVLYQGLRLLRQACMNSGSTLDRIRSAGGIDLVDSVLPDQRDTYVEKLLPTAIALKQLFSPVDFEVSEIQTFLRTAKFDYFETAMIPEVDTSAPTTECQTCQEQVVDVEAEVPLQEKGAETVVEAAPATESCIISIPEALQQTSSN